MRTQLDIQNNYLLKGHSTIRIGGVCSHFAEASNENSIMEALEYAYSKNKKVHVIGAGSNVLIGENPDTFVLKMVMRDVEVIGEKIIAKAGVYLPTISRIALCHGLTGFEWASAIPGTIGGAAIMNAGAYDTEFFDKVEAVTGIDMNGNKKTIPRSDIETSHRSSNIHPENFIVTEVSILLQKGDIGKIEKKMLEYTSYRKRTQPKGLTLGSTFMQSFDFTRGTGVSAGYYIDQCGLKGFTVGGASFSKIHANFIMNQGGGTFSDVLDLMEQAYYRVQEKFGVKLRPEVKILADSLLTRKFVSN
ncbi:UDP-N-acetylmuramate dehydrogenase [Paenibacillus glycinis]|uniref:UDP-N-acetylenolpyruvoylglucosamine reductase n=1 Tax=Paenibacillus glycinis TaxID=2697035 RepID=A0ABW9XT62_9BACL|nr:UDP-N-acetylmuramate dehydrogenase [Paenibacillus glycinis]NBD25529.1 UDP-N-acetylmuramate dehydrogenase [Paenibacillus glycinis]